MHNNTMVEGAIIDAHQHFWHYHPEKHSWIDDDMAVIRKDFLPEDLQPVYQQNGVAGCVAVQADQTLLETDFLLQLSQQHSFIKGIVGWVDLRADNIHEQLSHYHQYNIIKGFRHVLQGEEPAFMLQPNFLRGIAALEAYNFTYDILIFPNHLAAAIELVKKYPNQPFIIDHIAKPYIKAGRIDQWQKDIQSIAQYSNVYCKISGMVTEADYHHWKQADFTPYLDVVVQAFGTQRLCFGSDWPVCLVAADYAAMKAIVTQYFAQFTIAEQQQVFFKNAIAFYKL